MVDSSPKLSGEPTVEALSNGLATLGRYGDNYMVHAAEGETIIPKEILDANPGLKDDLFRQMTMMGVEDPNRYVVGSDLNSINPITGQPEFFFKKIFGVIKKVAAKILPIAAPIIGNLIAPGIGGIVASGLLAKMQGGTWGDAAKSAALSYGVGALGRGLQGGFAAGPGGFGEGFTSGLGRGLTEPFSAAKNLFAGSGIPLIGQAPGELNPLAQGIFGPRGTGTFFKGLAGTPFAQQGVGGLFPEYQDQQGISLNQPRIAPSSTSGQLTSVSGGDTIFVRPPDGQPISIPSEHADYLRSMNQLDANGRLTPRGAAFLRSPDYANALKLQSAASTRALPSGVRDVGGKLMFGDQNVRFKVPANMEVVPKEKSFWGKYGLPIAAGAGAVAYATGALDEEEESIRDQVAQLDAANPRRAAYDQWETIADKDSAEAVRLKTIWYGQDRLSPGELFAQFGANPPRGITAARGGEVFGSGTGTSDSIPARLSDGEFVMTAEAVRNAGGGDRALGAARMYDMMNQFERGAA